MAASSVSFIPVTQYLAEIYHPDMDYVDGVLEDRNVGKFDHSLIQRTLLLALAKRENQFGYLVIQELRVQISATRYRIPDTCLLPSDQLPERIVTHPPLLCIEVLSPEDRFVRVRTKCQDYFDLGVPEVWIFDPESRTVYVLRGNTMTEHRTGTLLQQELGLELDLQEIFSILDRS
jgi:Uma2 family endonuclease